MREYPVRPDLQRVYFPVAVLCLLLVPLVLPGWPVDTLSIAVTPDANNVLVKAPALLGREVKNTIIHSVQLTPVIDIYRVQEGRIWAWQERIMSHNAGLPSLKPERGRFAYDPPWMIVEGGGHAWEEIHYRVGTERLGKNELCVFMNPCMELWRELPGKKLILSVSPGRL